MSTRAMIGAAARVAALEAARVLLEGMGVPLTSAGTPGPAVPVDAGVYAMLRRPAATEFANPDSTLVQSGARDLLVTLAGAVRLVNGQRVTLTDDGASESYVVRGPVELRGITFDAWAVVPLGDSA